MSGLFLESEQASAMEYGRDLDDIIAQAVDDSIVAVDDLTNRLVASSGSNFPMNQRRLRGA